MSFGGGHLLDMIVRMRQNRAQRPSNRTKFKEHNREIINSINDKSEQSIFKTVPEKELLEIRKQIEETAKSERQEERSFYLIALTLGLLVAIVLLIWLM